MNDWVKGRFLRKTLPIVVREYRSRRSSSRFWSVFLVLVLIVPGLAACSADRHDNGKERVLRIAAVAYGGPEDSYFRMRYTDLFEFSHPDVHIEMVPLRNDDRYRYTQSDGPLIEEDPTDRLKETMKGDNPPDVVIVNGDSLAELIRDNLLQPLDPFIARDKFDLAGIAPSVIAGLKQITADNKLYALAPEFQSSVLIYNKTWLDKASISYPSDNMTWDELFRIADLLRSGEGENRQYGFAFNASEFADPFYQMSLYSGPLQLRYYDDNGENMSVDSDSWAKVWGTIAALIEKRVIPGRPDDLEKLRQQANNDYSPIGDNLFLSGKTAMTIFSPWEVNEIVNIGLKAGEIEGFTPFTWDIAPVPVHANYENVGGNMYLKSVAGINAKAQNSEDAWAFIEMLNGDQWARLKSSDPNSLLSRTAYIQPKGGLSYDASAFYRLTPAPVHNRLRLLNEMPYLYKVDEIGQSKFKQVLSGQLPILDALKQWQNEGETLLKKMKDNPLRNPAEPPGAG